jgi:hypothetical protein
MRRYFFHLNHFRDYVLDEEGTDLPDVEAAKSEARQSIRDLVADRLRAKEPLTLWSIRICDEDGQLLADVVVADALGEVIAPTVFQSNGPDSHA